MAGLEIGSRNTEYVTHFRPGRYEKKSFDKYRQLSLGVIANFFRWQAQSIKYPTAFTTMSTKDLTFDFNRYYKIQQAWYNQINKPLQNIKS